MVLVDAAVGDWQWNVGSFFDPDYDAHTDAGHGIVPRVENAAGFRGFVAHLLAAQVKAALDPLLEREAQSRATTLTAAERATRLEAVDRKARTAAVREELLVLRLEAADVEMLRRQDAEPAIVLCTTLDTASTAV